MRGVRGTIIPCRTDRLSPELRSQSALGSISTGLRDHLGTRSVVLLFATTPSLQLSCPSCPHVRGVSLPVFP
eukprot:1143326-Pelagomonas_calceolata.AAC.5